MTFSDLRTLHVALLGPRIFVMKVSVAEDNPEFSEDAITGESYGRDKRGFDTTRREGNMQSKWKEV